MTDELISKTEMLNIIDDERFTVDRKFERLRGLKGQSGEWINLNEAKEHFKYINSLDKEQILHILDRLPTATVDNWIPCSERLPETHGCEDDGIEWTESDNVLVCDSDGCMFVARYEIDDIDRQDWVDELGSQYEKVVAWMELPEAYRKGEEK